MWEGLPSSLRIGPYTVRIAIEDNLEDNAWGFYIHEKHLIRVKRAQPSAVFAVDTVMHEINHAIWVIYRVGEDEAKEEVVCGMLATGWAQILRDSPALMAWLSEALRG